MVLYGAAEGFGVFTGAVQSRWLIRNWGRAFLPRGGYIAEVVDVPGKLEPNTNYL